MYLFVTLAVGVAGDHWTKDPRDCFTPPRFAAHGARSDDLARRLRFSREHELARAGFCGRCGNAIKDDVLVREGASGSTPAQS